MSLPFHVRLNLMSSTAVRAPDDAGSTPADPVPGDDDDDTPEDPPPPGYDSQPPAKTDAHKPPAQVDNDGKTPTRPKDLPDQYWDPRKGEIRLDALIKSHNDTKKMVGEKEDVTRERLRTEIMAELAPTDLPATAADYKLADEIAKQVQADDPLLAAFREAAYENKMSPAAFNAVISKVLASMPPPDPAKETEALGKDGATRIDRVSKFVNKHVTEPGMKALAENLATTADGVRLIERLIGVKVAGERVGSDDTGAPANAPSMAEIKQAMNDDRYQPGPMQDPAYIARVDRMKDDYFKSKGGRRALESGM